MSTKVKSKVKDREIKYGNVEMTDEEYIEAQNPKIRTTIFLEADLIRAYKEEAVKKGMKYQQLMRNTLKQALGQTTEIEERLERLEKRVFKKKA